MNLERFIGWYGDKDIRTVQKKKVSEFLSELIERENYLKNTIDGILGDLSSFFNWAEGSGLISQNPVTGVSRIIPTPKGQSIDDQANLPYKYEMLERWFNHVKGEESIFAISCIGIYTGMRLDEICCLNKEDFIDECFQITNGKTRSSIRKIPVHQILIPCVFGGQTSACTKISPMQYIPTQFRGCTAGIKLYGFALLKRGIKLAMSQ